MPLELIGLLKGKDVLVGCIDVASNIVETPEEVAATIRAALAYVPAKRLYPCTNCGMATDGRADRLRKAHGAGGGGRGWRARRREAPLAAPSVTTQSYGKELMPTNLVALMTCHVV